MAAIQKFILLILPLISKHLIIFSIGFGLNKIFDKVRLMYCLIIDNRIKKKIDHI